MTQQASTDHPIHSLLATRWSPYAFDERPVDVDDLCSLFEAARWAASSYNEQPWRFIVATRDDEEGHATLLSCLVEANQAWARRAPVLALGVVCENFARNGRANPAATHDLGLATGNLMIEATARELSVHAMIGIDPERARSVYRIPEDARAYTALAIGYRAPSSSLPDGLRQRDEAPRQRKALGEFVFGSRFGNPALLVP